MSFELAPSSQTWRLLPAPQVHWVVWPVWAREQKLMNELEWPQ